MQSTELIQDLTSALADHLRASLPDHVQITVYRGTMELETEHRLIRLVLLHERLRLVRHRWRGQHLVDHLDYADPELLQRLTAIVSQFLT